MGGESVLGWLLKGKDGDDPNGDGSEWEKVGEGLDEVLVWSALMG